MTTYTLKYKIFNGFLNLYSESSDDDKIVSYKWEEMKAPINSHGKIVSNGAHKPILELKNLEAGDYTFRFFAF